MASMTNTATLVFGQGQTGWDANWLMFYDTEQADNLLLQVQFASDILPLTAGEGYVIPPNNLTYTQPEGTNENPKMGIRKLKGMFVDELWLGLGSALDTRITDQDLIEVEESDFEFTE